MNDSDFQPGENFAIEMDERDPLRTFREQFLFPDSSSGQPSIYLCGHSLGLQPRTAAAYVQQELDDWARFGVEGHFHARHPWMPYHRLLTQQTAELVGANPAEVVVMNSLTVNLHLMMVSFYRPTLERHKIIVERGAFPSDQYAIKSQILFHGFLPSNSLIELTPRKGESCLREEDIEDVIDRNAATTALIMLGGVNYATGQAFDLDRIARAGHKHGCIVGFDLAHAAGNLPLTLHDSAADFAVWCSYKYLNGGPGCTAGCFIHERHAHSWNLPRFAGWWGHDERTRFAMPPDFQPMRGAEGWQLSNPPIVSLAVLRASMDIFQKAGIERLRAKSTSLTNYLEFLLNRIQSQRFLIITPCEPERRGAQLSICIPQNGRDLCQRLIQQGVIGDWREPDTFRIAPVPLYNSYRDVYRFAQKFAALVHS